jgi:hypothetical protein
MAGGKKLDGEEDACASSRLLAAMFHILRLPLIFNAVCVNHVTEVQSADAAEIIC